MELGLPPPRPVRHRADGNIAFAKKPIAGTKDDAAWLSFGLPENILEHQMALQRYVFEWATRYEQILHTSCSNGLMIGDAGFLERILEHDPPPPPLSMPACLLSEPSPSKTITRPPMRDQLADLSGITPRDDMAAMVAVDSGEVPTSATDSGLTVVATDSLFGQLRQEFAADLKQVKRMRTTFELEKQGAKSRHSIVHMCEVLERSQFFQRCCSLVILVNACCLAYTTEFAIRQAGDPSYEVFLAFERTFCCFYLFEILVRLVAQRKQFFIGEDVPWNVFDTILASMSAQEQIMSVLSRGLMGQDLSYLRIIRVMKMIKVLRMIRLMRAFRELRLVMDSMLGSMRALLWSFLLVAFICFMFGLCFVQAANDLASLEDEGANCMQLWESMDEADARAESSDAQFACIHWGSIGSSMLSLFQASTAGYDWEVLARPLLKAGNMYYAIFCFYIGFFLFIVMNSVTSLFLDNVMTNAQTNEDQIMQDQLARKKQYMSKVVKIFSLVDEDGSGAITYDEFLTHKRDPMLVAFANSLDIEPDALEQFFGLLSGGGKRPVDLETFVVGCIRVRGHAKSMDLLDLLVTQQRVEDEQNRFIQYCEEQFRAIRQAIQVPAAQ